MLETFAGGILVIVVIGAWNLARKDAVGFNRLRWLVLIPLIVFAAVLFGWTMALSTFVARFEQAPAYDGENTVRILREIIPPYWIMWSTLAVVLFVSLAPTLSKLIHTKRDDDADQGGN